MRPEWRQTPRLRALLVPEPSTRDNAWLPGRWVRLCATVRRPGAGELGAGRPLPVGSRRIPVFGDRSGWGACVVRPRSKPSSREAPQIDDLCGRVGPAPRARVKLAKSRDQRPPLAPRVTLPQARRLAWQLRGPLSVQQRVQQPPWTWSHLGGHVRTNLSSHKGLPAPPRGLRIRVRGFKSSWARHSFAAQTLGCARFRASGCVWAAIQAPTAIHLVGLPGTRVDVGVCPIRSRDHPHRGCRSGGHAATRAL